MALKLGDYAVTEAGFAADLGAEKFFDIKCRLSGLRPSAVVIVATVRALKYHGGVPKAELNRENLSALEKGLPNLLHHVGTIRNTFHLPCVVAVNAFPTDTAEELRLVQERCRELGVNAVLSEVWAKGGEGGRDLARELVRLCDQPRLEEFTFAYPDNTSLIYKLNSIVGRVYGGSQAVHGQDPVFPVRRPGPAGGPQGLHRHRPQSEGQRRSGVHRGLYRGHHDHAGPAPGPGGGEHRRGRKRRHHRAVLRGYM